MAVAVASGLIGNMSYDIVKKVFGKIVSYLKRSKKSCEDETLVAFLESPEKIKKFSEYISAYYDEYEGRGICGSCFSYHRRSDKNET